MYSPILVTVYDRIDKLKQLINSLLANNDAKHTDIFIAIDYPSIPEHIENHKKVVQYCEKIVGFKSVNLIKRESNFGSSHNGRKAREEIFKKYETLICIEDDNYVSPNFLSFMNNALEYYKDDERIFCVCGHNFPVKLPDNYDKDVYIWTGVNAYGAGWWREKFDSSYWELDNLVSLFLNPVLLENFIEIANHILPILFDGIKKGVIYGDAIVSLNLFINNKYQLYPRVSKVRNTGYDGDGENCGYDINYISQHLDDGSAEIRFEKDIQPSLDVYNVLANYFKRNDYLMRQLFVDINNYLAQQPVAKKLSESQKFNSVYNELYKKIFENNNEVYSPITRTKNVSLVSKIPVDKINQLYKDYDVDTERFFKGLSEISLYQCDKTGYQFFFPYKLEGDGQFYSQLEKIPWYYMEDKWEFAKASELIRSDDKVLEIGAGKGHFMKKMAQRGIEITGLELNEEAVRIAKQDGLAIYNETLDVHKTKIEQKYDVICAFQVLEHVGEVGTFISDCIDNLTDNGRLIFSVPNHSSFIKYDVDNILDMPPHHIGRWDEETFEKVANYLKLNIKGMYTEKLAEIHHNYYLNNMRRVQNDEQFHKTVQQLRDPNNEIKGHTILVELTLKAEEGKKLSNDKKNDSPKIVHICTQDNGGAGNAAYFINKGLQKLGVNSKLIVLNKTRTDLIVEAIPDNYHVTKSLVKAPYASGKNQEMWQRFFHVMNSFESRPKDLEIFTTPESNIDISIIDEIKEADIINLHWVAGMINFETVNEFFKNKIIIWTLHDMNVFTGGCHYAGSCTRFLKTCGCCPQLGSNLQSDLSNIIWKMKSDFYQNFEMTIVTPSKWLAREARRSSLLKNMETKVIPNAFDLSIFKPQANTEIRTKLGIPLEAKIVLFGAAYNNSRKGINYLIDALSKHISSAEKKEIFLAAFGQIGEFENVLKDYNIRSFGAVNNPEDLAKIYSMADVFVIPSLEDNLPNVVVESLACGTPVVGFNIGGIPDMVDHKSNGYLAKFKNTKDLAAGIRWCLKQDRNELSKAAQEKAVSEFELTLSAGKYLNLYNDLLDKSFTPLNEKNVSKTSSRINKQIVSSDHGNKARNLVSAIVSVYNSEEFIEGCLLDLVNQTLYKKGLLEIVVINSGSEQNEESIISQFLSNYDNFIYLKTEERETVYQAWNRAIRLANGKYITNANTDDRHRADGLEILYNALENDNGKVLAYGNSLVTKNANQPYENCSVSEVLRWPDFNREKLLEFCFIGPQPMWSKELHEVYGYFDESYKTAADYEFWLRVAHDNEFIHINDDIGVYYLDDNTVSRRGNLPLIEAEEIKEKYKKIYNESAGNKSKFRELILESIEFKGDGIPLDSIVNWQIGPVNIAENTISHKIDIKCHSCGMEREINFDLSLINNPQSRKVVCQSCKTETTLGDYNYSEFIEQLNQKFEGFEYSGQNKVAFLMRETSVIGGGTNIVYKHMNWLNAIGCEIIIYSYTAAPNWIELPGKFHQIRTLDDIDDREFDIIVAFSIFDVPGLFGKISHQRIVHICQGYEGYHYGRTFEETRSDKYIFTELHSLPNRTIVVSDHLTDLFNKKFDKKTEYIPNGIDHEIFNPKNYTKRNNSILFIGNPLHPLKGFEFLLHTIDAIQNTEHRIEGLTLNLVIGNKSFDVSYLEQKLVKYDCKFQIHIALSPAEVSELINKQDIVVCTSWYEGFSLPILEAMACGIPVITTSNMGIDSFCIDENNSFVLPYGDTVRFGTRILEILNNKLDLKNILDNGIKTASTFTNENSKKELVSVYSKLLNAKFSTNIINENLGIDYIPKNELSGKIELFDETIRHIDISIVIPTFNQWKYTKQTLDSIKKFTKADYEIIITDNASTDGTVETLQREYPEIKVIVNQENRGFPKAVNQGISAAEGEYVLIANNDIIFTEGWLERMMELIGSSSTIGIVGPISNSVSGYQIDENAKYKSIAEMHTYAQTIRKKNKGKILNFPRVAFLCTLIKKEVIEKIGGLDERFSPGNYEDDDFCLRAQLAGYKTVIAQDVFIHHFGSKSFKADGEQQYIDRLNTNRDIFVEKWGADPNDIWIHTKEFNKRKYTFPISKNLFKQNFERGIQFFEEQEMPLAVESFMNALEHYDAFIGSSGYNIPKTEVINLAGNVFLSLNLFEEANTLFENQLKLDPESGEACLGLGQIFYATEMLEEAKTMFEYAVEYLPENKNAQESLQKVNQLLGVPCQNVVAESEINQSSGSDDLIETYIEKGNFTEAKMLILEQLPFNDSDVYLLNNLSVIYIMEEKYKEASEIIGKILTLNPNDETAQNNLTHLEGIINSTLLEQKNVDGELSQVEDYIEKGDLVNAKELLKKMLIANPQNVDALNDLVVVLIMEEKFDKASEAILEVLKIDPNNEIAAENLNYLEQLINNYLQ